MRNNNYLLFKAIIKALTKYLSPHVLDRERYFDVSFSSKCNVFYSYKMFPAGIF